MSQTHRKTIPAAVLAVVLVVLPALPALAAPADSAVGSVLAWLDAWLAWPSDAVARITGADEALPSADPNGAVALPVPPDGSGANTNQTTGDNDGEALPSVDPDG